MNTWKPFVLSYRPITTRPVFVSITRFWPCGALWMSLMVDSSSHLTAARERSPRSLPCRPHEADPVPIHLVQRQARTLGTGASSRAHARAALRVERVRGHPRVLDAARAGDPRTRRARAATLPLVQDRQPAARVHRAPDRGRDPRDRAREQARRVLHPPARVPRLRRAGRVAG